MRTKGRSPGERPAPRRPEQRAQSHAGGLPRPRTSPANPSLAAPAEVRGKADEDRRGVHSPWLLRRWGREQNFVVALVPVAADPQPGPALKVATASPWDTVSKTRADPFDRALLEAFQKKSQVMGRGSLPVLWKRKTIFLGEYFTL